MDTIIYSVLRITVMILILRTIFRLFSYQRAKPFWLNLKKKNASTSLSEDQEQHVQEKEAPTVEMVVDHAHGNKMPKKQAYILLDRANTPVYFSDWDDRQQYINVEFSGIE